MQFISAVCFVLVLLTSAVRFWRTGHPVHDVHLGGPPLTLLCVHSSCRFLLYSVSLWRFGSSPFGSLISPLCAIAWDLFPFSPRVLSHKGWSPSDLVPCSSSAPVSASDSGLSVAPKCYCGRSLLGLLTACTQFLTLIPSLEWGWELSFGFTFSIVFLFPWTLHIVATLARKTSVAPCGLQGSTQSRRPDILNSAFYQFCLPISVPTWTVCGVWGISVSESWLPWPPSPIFSLLLLPATNN